MLISDRYRQLNAELHKELGTYGSSGGGWVKAIKHIAGRYETEDVLDYGCGKGTLAAQMPYPIKEYDPAVEGKEALPEPADIVVCTDVLEHIEPECLAEVLDHIRDLTKIRAFITIAIRKAKKKLPDGRNAHLIIKPADWWLLKLTKRFKVVHWDVDNKKGEIVAVVKPVRRIQ